STLGVIPLLLNVQLLVLLRLRFSCPSEIQDVEKSPTDTRDYLAMELPNGMKVILVSDPDTKISAAAMDVHVGYFSDPDYLPGLAHFCEHLLFLGTDKYPDEAR
ncbi:unnamed protein product, partial [Hapterophycus canaliculatus]